MRFTKYVIVCGLFFSISCSKKIDPNMLPEYRVIKTFSAKIKPKTELVLRGYGINNNLPKDYQFKNHIANFRVSFALFKTQQDMISLEEARSLVISVANSFLQEINSNSEMRPLLDIYPFTNDMIGIAIYFEDENSIDLGTGISTVYLSKGKIKYEHYEISEYRSQYPSIGTHFIVHQESYQDALEIVKKEGSMIDLGISNIPPAWAVNFSS